MDANTTQKVHNAYIYTEENELDRFWREDAPKTLIKFFPAKYEADGTNYFLKHIKERTMWLASPSTFNDPFDCVVNINYESEAYRFVNLVLHRLVGGVEARKIINLDLFETCIKESSVLLEQNMSKVYNETEYKIYVTCFSEPDNLFSLRMWGHYAQNHSGVCAEYDFYDVNNLCPFGCIPVMYTDVYSHKNYTVGTVENTRNILNLIYNKASEWEYEKEWRVAYYLDEDKQLGFSSKCELPKRIYLGCKVNETLKRDILMLCRDNGIELFQMALKPGSYELFYEKIDV